MAKVLSVISKQSKDGQKTYYEVALQKEDGSQIGATAFEELKIGDVIEESRIVPGKEGRGFIIKSLSKGKGGAYQKSDEELIVAQCAFKGMVDLRIAERIPSEKFSAETCLHYARMIMDTAQALKARTAKSETTKPVAKPEAKKGMQPIDQGDLESATKDWENASPKDFNNERNRLYNALGWGGDQVKEFLIHEGYPDGIVPVDKRYAVLEHLKAKLPKEAK